MDFDKTNTNANNKWPLGEHENSDKCTHIDSLIPPMRLG